MDRCCFRLVLLVELRAYADFYVIAAPKHRHDRPPLAIALVPIGVTEGIPDSEQSRRRLWAIRWPRVCKPVKVVCIAAFSLELGAIGNAAPMKTDVIFRTHQEVDVRSLNAVAELTHLRPVALLWGAPLKAAPNEAATLVHKYANPPARYSQDSGTCRRNGTHRLEDSQESKSDSRSFLIVPESLTTSRRPN